MRGLRAISVRRLILLSAIIMRREMDRGERRGRRACEGRDWRPGCFIRKDIPVGFSSSLFFVVSFSISMHGYQLPIPSSQIRMTLPSVTLTESPSCLQRQPIYRPLVFFSVPRSNLVWNLQRGFG
ncbi:hypothetical protein M413DRAFT_125413 [Hebeloma cylindrosporum]|uniref:Uncharacterized protein n=1 Tax=Hebeloma cylindrosporum TaxID=76867 RepID=A0A0C3CFD4_HEBCY|nr:hypothetical protein M413DRAFT_125413 [Hebeloma cylindrosporum h7]